MLVHIDRNEIPNLLFNKDLGALERTLNITWKFKRLQYDTVLSLKYYAYYTLHGTNYYDNCVVRALGCLRLR